MPGPAQVHSSEAIEAVRLALMSFVESVNDALAELGGEVRRVQEWLEHDRPGYWRNQTRISMDQVHEAQQALHRCLMFPVAGERPSCYEERAALKKAHARQVYCQQKTERVRHWQQTLRHEMFEYEGRISQLVKLVEIDVPQAINVLNRILRQLEEYHAVRAANPKAAYDDVAMAREIWSNDEQSKSSDGAPDAEKAPVQRDEIGRESTPDDE
jgi:hypothetical protein